MKLCQGSTYANPYKYLKFKEFLAAKSKKHNMEVVQLLGSYIMRYHMEVVPPWQVQMWSERKISVFLSSLGSQMP